MKRLPHSCRLAGALAMALGLVLAASGCSSNPSSGRPPVTVPAASSAAGVDPVGEALQRLTDPAAAAADRRGAALSLLREQSDAAAVALAQAVQQADDPAATRAVVQAIVLNDERPPRELALPLLDRLLTAEEDLQGEIADALGRLADRRLVDRLAGFAVDPLTPRDQRRAAIRALGYQRTRESAATLMQLIDPDESPVVQETAFAALANLSGLDRLEQDRHAWAQWWEQHRRLGSESWAATLMENLARRDAERRVQHHETEKRLLESQRALYRTTAPDDRPAVMAYMLNDPLAAIRLLGMELAFERQLEGLPFAEPLREALRARLTDPAAALREQAALRLADLGDQPAARIVARRLADQQEHVTTVQRAYLVLMARMPQPEAVRAALDLLARHSLRSEAAAALAAMAEAGLLDAVQAQQAASVVRRSLDDRLPPPSVVRLLGQVGDRDDWRRIARWIDAEDPAVKQAAAQAWAGSDRPLRLLAERVEDPVIQLIVIDAAFRRGDDAVTLDALSQTWPDRPQVFDAWRRAMIAIAGRVPADALLQTVVQLRQRQTAPANELARQMLTSALQREHGRPLTPATRSRLLLERAELALIQNAPDQALQDALSARADDEALAPAEVSRLYRTLIEANLQLGQPDEAFAAARYLQQSPGASATTPTDDPLADRFIEYARGLAGRQQVSDAMQVLERLRDLLGPSMKPEVGQRVALLLAELSARQAPLPEPAAAPPGALTP